MKTPGFIMHIWVLDRFVISIEAKEYHGLGFGSDQKKENEDDLKILSEIHFPDSLANVFEWEEFLMTQRQYVTKYGGGVTHEMTGMWPVIKMVLDTREYTFKEKLSFMQGSMFSLENLWLEIIALNLNKDIDSMQVPVYIFQGVCDYQTSFDVAKDFYKQLKAPQKEFFTFENSAHSPVMEEVEKFNRIVRQVIIH